jgi:hypothetical protein
VDGPDIVPEPLTPELVAEIMDAITAGHYVSHTARCGACEYLDEHRYPPAWHTWAGLDRDVAHAAVTGQPDPSMFRCGCSCAVVTP